MIVTEGFLHWMVTFRRCIWAKIWMIRRCQLSQSGGRPLPCWGQRQVQRTQERNEFVTWKLQGEGRGCGFKIINFSISLPFNWGAPCYLLWSVESECFHIVLVLGLGFWQFPISLSWSPEPTSKGIQLYYWRERDAWPTPSWVASHVRGVSALAEIIAKGSHMSNPSWHHSGTEMSLPV